MGFKIITDLNESEVYEGMLIDYTVRPLFGIPLKWQTEICRVDRPSLFTDRQLKGPYSVWEHTHRFIEQPHGILMKDEINYQLPFGFIGKITNYLVVKKKIADIFSYREKALKRIFNSGQAA